MFAVELPPPPAPLIARLEASFPLPAALSPYEYLWASEGEPLPAVVPVRQFHGDEPVRLAFSESAMANPIKLLLDRLGYYFRPLFREIRDGGVSPVPVTEHDGLGDGSPDPVPAGDPIPVDGGGKPGG
jgi:hypothetical protein